MCIRCDCLWNWSGGWTRNVSWNTPCRVHKKYGHTGVACWTTKQVIWQKHCSAIPSFTPIHDVRQTQSGHMRLAAEDPVDTVAVTEGVSNGASAFRNARKSLRKEECKILNPTITSPTEINAGESSRLERNFPVKSKWQPLKPLWRYFDFTWKCVTSFKNRQMNCLVFRPGSSNVMEMWKVERIFEIFWV